MADLVDGAIAVSTSLVLPFLLVGRQFIHQATDEYLLLGSSLTSIALLARILISNPLESFLDALLICLGGAVVWTFVAILFGAPIFELVSRTFMWGLLQSSLSLLPLAKVPGHSEHRFYTFKRMLFREKPLDFTERRLWGGFYGACLGAWMGTFFIPLDWDEPWQAWPIPLYYGSIIGWLVGIIGGSSIRI